MNTKITTSDTVIEITVLECKAEKLLTQLSLITEDDCCYGVKEGYICGHQAARDFFKNKIFISPRD